MSEHAQNKGATNAQGHQGARPEVASFKSRIFPRLSSPMKEGVERGTVWLIRIIESGQSLNGPNYTAESLREAIPMFEGSPVYNYSYSGGADPRVAKLGHLPDDVAKQDSRGLMGNLVGAIEGVHYNEEAQALDGYLKVYDKTLRTRMVEAYDLGDIGEGGGRDLFGFSIDARGDKNPETGQVMRITEANSVDFVTRPAAGGRVRRLVAGLDPDGSSEDNAADEVEEEPAALAAEQALAESESEEMPVSADKNKPAAKPVKLQEMANGGKLAAELHKFADAVSTAPDEELGSVVDALLVMIADYMAAPMEEAAEPKPGEEETTMPKPNAQSDDFARMTAGLKEALKSPEVQKNAPLRESLESALGAKLEEDERDVEIRSLRERLTEQAIQHEAAAFREEVEDLETLLTLIPRDSIKVSKDYTKVEGLKEAVDAFLEAKPYFRKKAAPEPAPLAEAVAPEPKPAAKPAEPVQLTEAEALGQNVPLRESVPEVQISPAAARRRMASLKRRMLGGDTDAAVEHKRLRAALG